MKTVSPAHLPQIKFPPLEVFIQRAQERRIKASRNSLLSRRTNGTTDIFTFKQKTNLIYFTERDYSKLFEDILDQSMGADRIVLDFSNVVEMNADDSLVKFLVKLNHLESKPLILCGLNQDTLNLFRELFLDSIFTIKPTAEEALNKDYIDNVA